MRIDLDAHHLAQVTKALAAAPEIALEELSAAALESTLYLQRETAERTPSGASGGAGLRASWLAARPRVLADLVVGEMGSPLAYAEAVELGTRPHMPPVAPIEDWVRTSGKIALGVDDDPRQVAFAIARKIAREGTEGAFMLRDAVEAGEETVGRIFGLAVDRLTERVARQMKGDGA